MVVQRHLRACTTMLKVIDSIELRSSLRLDSNIVFTMLASKDSMQRAIAEQSVGRAGRSHVIARRWISFRFRSTTNISPQLSPTKLQLDANMSDIEDFSNVFQDLSYSQAKVTEVLGNKRSLGEKTFFERLLDTMHIKCTLPSLVPPALRDVHWRYFSTQCVSTKGRQRSTWSA